MSWKKQGFEDFKQSMFAEFKKIIQNHQAKPKMQSPG